MEPHPAFRSEPDPSVDSASRVPLAPEMSAIDRQVGWMVINRWTYRLFRAMGKWLKPPADLSGVTVHDMPGVGRGVMMVEPAARRGRGAVFLIHGGGYVVGTKESILAPAAGFARALGVPVICPAYALGPERPFPAGQNDLHTVWHWALENSAELGIDPARIVIGGYSAGGSMAAGLVQRLHDEGGVQPAAQLLVYPMLDDRVAARRELDNPRHRCWSNRNNLFGWTGYLGQAPGGAVPPYAVPGRRSDLAGLPPVWLGIGTSDLFLDEDRAYLAALRADGVDVTYVEVAGAMHAFDLGDGPMAKAFVAAQTAFLERFVV